MKVRIDIRGDVAVVSVDGSVSQEVVPLFKLKLQELIEEGRAKIVLDLDATSYISSIGLAVVTNVKGTAADKGGDLKVARMNFLVRNLFEITNLLRKLEAYDTVDEAVAAFEKSG